MWGNLDSYMKEKNANYDLISCLNKFQVHYLLVFENENTRRKLRLIFISYLTRKGYPKHKISRRNHKRWTYLTIYKLKCCVYKYIIKQNFKIVDSMGKCLPEV